MTEAEIANSQHGQSYLSSQQATDLVQYSLCMADQCLPLTTQIIKDLAYEIC